ncbi:MAG TPA: hypothetical protein VGI45_14085 [Terracidiphilus sp.]|jgi:hypothetical protein
MSPTRLELKCPSGWFAAGREVRLAATRLSDSAFKLFVWTCLHAERNSGRLRLVVGVLARSLQKTEDEIDFCIQELVRAGVYRVYASGFIQIQEQFWPYQRNPPESEIDDAEAYVAAIRRLFVHHGCVASSFSPADERLAADWCHRGIPLERAERAIDLGVARKYAALLNNGKGSPITTLSYFENLIDEVGRATVSPEYWRHVKHRTEQFQRRWRTLTANTRSISTPAQETK